MRGITVYFSQAIKIQTTSENTQQCYRPNHLLGDLQYYPFIASNRENKENSEKVWSTLVGQYHVEVDNKVKYLEPKDLKTKLSNCCSYLLFRYTQKLIIIVIKKKWKRTGRFILESPQISWVIPLDVMMTLQLSTYHRPENLLIVQGSGRRYCREPLFLVKSDNCEPSNSCL